MKINEDKLLDCIGEVGDDLIHESETAVPFIARRGYGSWLSAAAVLVLGLVVIGLHNLGPGLFRVSDDAAYNDAADRSQLGANMPAAEAPNDSAWAEGAAPPEVAMPEYEYAAPEALLPSPTMPGLYREDVYLYDPAHDNEDFWFSQVYTDEPCPNCEAHDCWYFYWMGSIEATPPVRLLYEDERPPLNPYHAVDMNQLPTMHQEGWLEIILMTDEPLNSVSIIALEPSFLLGQTFLHVIDSHRIGYWQPGVPLILQNYIWNGHATWFAITFHDAAGNFHYLTVQENFVGGCVPQFFLTRLDADHIIPLGWRDPPDMHLLTLERVAPPLITELLGDFIPGEIREFRNMEYPFHVVMYRHLYHEPLDHFYIQHATDNWGNPDPHLSFASVIARQLMDEGRDDRRVMWSTSQGFMTEYQFDTQTGDALFLYAPRLNATWLLIDIGPSPWMDDPTRSYVVIFRP
ncbi:MAG: hypothetical protein FWC71_08785 [Defluviitaleaceae bacterium]|nr:hypothetical protein [Defluviitaleaceae bacterium]